MSELRSPEMSVILVTPDTYENIREVMNLLREQTVKDSLEIVIVAPSIEMLNLDNSVLSGFSHVQLVEVGAFSSTGEAIAEGIRKANAPVVAFCEEHSYPDPGWAEALIDAHRKPWAAVGCVITNANPDSLISWASIYLDFGPCVDPAEGGEVKFLAPHHVSYKRDILLNYGPDLSTMYEIESILCADLLAKGQKLYLEPRSKRNHVNISRLGSYIRGEFIGGRIFGAVRAKQFRWSAFRRILYICGFPLIPLLRLWRTSKDISRTGRGNELMPQIILVLLIGLVSSAAGEVLGYAFGHGKAPEQRITFEVNRSEHLVKQDIKAKA
ncbi:MAG: glycosyltransferase [Candidatus Dadabacteria bacterium]|nr:glycosyltransferase [Candidatus Dadabacteria bacterium]